MFFFIEEVHVLPENEIKYLKAVTPRHMLNDSVTEPSNERIGDEITEGDDEEHEGVEVSLINCLSRWDLECSCDSRE